MPVPLPLLAALSATLTVALAGTSTAPVTTVPDEPPASTTPPRLDALAESADTITDEQAADWLLDYTRGSAERARGLPVRIGFATDEVGFPGWSDGADAAVRYLNAELGGIGGRRVELVSCPVRLTSEAASCAAAFATDPTLDLVITGAFTSGGTRFLNRLAGNHAVLVGSATTIGDLTSPSAVSFAPGTSGLAAGAVTFAVTDLQATNVAVLVSDDEHGEAAAQVIQPLLTTAGAEAAIVYLPDGATPVDATAALHAAGADRAEATVLFLPPGLCRAAHDAVGTLDARPTVITTDTCIDAAGAEPGWYSVGSGFSPQLPDLASGMAGAIHVWHHGVAASVDGTEHAGTAPAELPTTANVMGIATVLTAARLLNDVGTDPAPEDLDAALRMFGGPMMAQPGPIICGIPPHVAVCVHVVGIGRVDDTGGWEPIRSTLLDNPVGVD